MDFEVQYYYPAGSEGESAEPPILDFLNELGRRQRPLYNLLLAGLKKLENRSYHRPPLTELVDAEHAIYELRVGRADIARAFFFFRSGQRIVVTNGYVKKRQKVDVAELERARRYKRDWESRFP